jgi:hypothetical protein
MRALIALVSILVFLQPHTAAAVFYNNSDVIEIGDGSPDDPSAPSSGGPDAGGTGGSSGGTTQTDQGTGGGTSAGGSSDTSGPGSASDAASGGSGSSSGGSSSSSSGGSSGGGSGSGSTESDIIQLLINGGAITGAGRGSSSAGSGDGASGDVSGSVAAGGSGTTGSSGSAASRGTVSGGGSGSLSVRVVASKVRDALKDNVDLKTLLQYWKRAPKAGAFTSDEYGLIAASTALRDSNVQEVTFTASKFEIVYRSRGYLIGLFPWSFPVRVAIVPDASSPAERVNIKLPWYRFFIRKFFTNDSLVADIDAVIAKTKKENTDPDADGKAIVFDAVSLFLKTKVGTVGDSVILGIPAS